MAPATSSPRCSRAGGSGRIDPSLQSRASSQFFSRFQQPGYRLGMRGCPPLRLVFVLLACVLVLACRSYDSGPNLLQVVEFSPGSADVGDRLELTGTGFPE